MDYPVNNSAPTEHLDHSVEYASIDSKTFRSLQHPEEHVSVSDYTCPVDERMPEPFNKALKGGRDSEASTSTTSATNEQNESFYVNFPIYISVADANIRFQSRYLVNQSIKTLIQSEICWTVILCFMLC